ncbi:MAG TPA: M15 family metallopeptidase [Jiangellales bacterium]|nr:M15 family metallopeptidase [Jiangellales bacterium]
MNVAEVPKRDLRRSIDRAIVLIADARVANIPVLECNEPLVDLRGLLCVDSRRADVGGAFAYVRSGVAQRLCRADALLPNGWRLLVIEGFRPVTVQQEIFDSYVADLRLLLPTWSASELAQAASRYVAPVDVAPHTAGAAVDLTLCDADGVEIDMGSPEAANPEESNGACYMDALDISPAARRNRQTLAAALTSVGMVNYPTEWWHWSFGDRYWAFHTGQANARYGACPDPGTTSRR